MKFKSQYLQLEVLAPNGPIRFKSGEYETTDKEEIKVLKTISDIVVVDEPHTKE